MVEKQLSDALNRAARMGQRGDTEVGHLTPREVVIPIAVQKRFPEAMRALRGMFTEAGLNYEQYVVGNKANKIHARTGKPQFFEGNDSSGYGEGSGSNTGEGSGMGPEGSTGVGPGTLGGELAGGPASVGSSGRAGPEGAIDPGYGGQMSDTSYGGPAAGRSTAEMNANDAVNAARAETQNLSAEFEAAKMEATLANAIQAGVLSPSINANPAMLGGDEFGGSVSLGANATSSPANSPSSTTATSTTTETSPTSTSTTTSSVSPSTSTPNTTVDVAENEAQTQALENALGMVANNPATTVASPPGVTPGDSDPSMLGGDPGVSLSLGSQNLGGPSTSELGGTGGGGSEPFLQGATQKTAEESAATTGAGTAKDAVNSFLLNLGKTTYLTTPNVYTPFPTTQGIASLKPYSLDVPPLSFPKVPYQI